MSLRLKVVIYSHDAMGLGHMRRNLLVAEGLSRHATPMHVLLIAGAPELGAFRLPAHVDTLTLPPLIKTLSSEYIPRNSPGPAAELIALRSEIIHTAVKGFAPDVLIADKLPRGLLGELDPTLRELRASGSTRCVLGLRDILDHPLSVRREWTRAGNDRIVHELYDAVWVYGDPAVYDPRREYGFSEDVSAKVRFTGYLNPESRLRDDGTSYPPEFEAIPGRYAACTVGGGQDGADLAMKFAEATLADDLLGVVMTGPFMEVEAKRRLCGLAAGCPRLRVLEFVNNPGPILRRAERIVTMGGYNALTEALSLQRPTLAVPRVRPRTEQLLRASRFAELGLLDMLHPGKATVEAIGKWLSRPARERPPARDRIDFRGLEQLPRFLDDVLDGSAGGETSPATESA